MSNDQRIIGIYAVSWWETSIRTFEGAMQFADEVGGLAAATFAWRRPSTCAAIRLPGKAGLTAYWS